jgi:hemerythrin-like domain-containing protein
MTTVQYADVRAMIMLHNALRREFRPLPAVVRGVRHGDTERARTVAEHVDFVTTILHAHHRGEDLVLWPILLERAPAELAPTVHVMEGHHGQIDQIGQHVAAALAGWWTTADATIGVSLAEALGRLTALLDVHLSIEEEHILPVAANHVTMDEWNQMGAAAGTHVPPELVPVGVGMLMYEGDPEVVEVDMARMPPEAWKTMKETAPEAYEAHSLRVHGVLLPRGAA